MTSAYEDPRMTLSSLTEFNASAPSNESFRVDIHTAILWYFYDKLHSETNYLLIVLYVPVMAIAVTANVLVIAVVFKYHYMRRYVASDRRFCAV